MKSLRSIAEPGWWGGLLVILLGILTGCGGESAALELSKTRPSLLFFYTDN